MKKSNWSLCPFLTVFLWVGVSEPAAASGLCTMADTELECRVKVQVATAKELGFDLGDDAALEAEAEAEKAKKAVENNTRLMEQSTGVPAVASLTGSSGSVISDFLALLQISADSGGLSGDEGEAVVVELNRFLRIPTKAGYKLTARLEQAELYEPLANQIGEQLGDGAAGRITALEKGLNDLDDLTVSFVYQPVKKTWGRNPNQYADTFSVLFDATRAGLGEALPKAYEDLVQEREEIVQEYQSALLASLEEANPGLDEDAIEAAFFGIAAFDEDGLITSFSAISEVLSEEAAGNLLELVETAEAARIGRRAALLKELKARHFFEFADPINNQPQFYVSLAVTSRDDLVGPGQTHGKLTYEKGFVNVNALRSVCRVDRGNFLACYERYLTAEKLAQLTRGDRVALSIEYIDVEDLNVSLPEDGLTFRAVGDRTVVASFAYGRYVGFAPDGSGQRRIDLTYNYEDVGTDPNRKDRSALDLNYSQRVAGDVTFSAGIVWANEPEFRGDVSEDLSAKLGLNYKLFRKDGEL